MRVDQSITDNLIYITFCIKTTFSRLFLPPSFLVSREKKRGRKKEKKGEEIEAERRKDDGTHEKVQ